MFIKEDVEVMLRNHLKNEAKLTEIQLKKEEYEEKLRYAGTVYEDTEKEIIEGMQLKGQVISDIPRSITNTVSDKVYNTAMTYNREKHHINKENRAELQSKILKCEEEERKLNKDIVRVKNIIQPLSIEESFVIKLFYFHSSKWDYIEEEFFIEFKKHKTVKQLQNYRDNALDTMMTIINMGA